MYRGAGPREEGRGCNSRRPVSDGVGPEFSGALRGVDRTPVPVPIPIPIPMPETAVGHGRWDSQCAGAYRPTNTQRRDATGKTSLYVRPRESACLCL